MKARNPENGKVYDVTKKSWELVYKTRGFELVEGEETNEQTGQAGTDAAGNTGGAGNGNDNAGNGNENSGNDQTAANGGQSDGQPDIEEMTKKQIMAELKENQVPFTDRATVDELREQLKEARAEKAE